MNPALRAYADRFLSHVELSRTCACWTWIGAHDDAGYGNAVTPESFPGAGKSRRMKAHRVSVTLFRGIVLGPRQGHHCCATACTCGRNWKDCVNPDHVESATQREHFLQHHPGADWAEREAMIW